MGRLRTNKTRGCLSRTTMLAMVFKLCQSAAQRGQRSRAAPYLPEIIRSVRFKDSIRVDQEAACVRYTQLLTGRQKVVPVL
jgi:hypothetical protein